MFLKKIETNYKENCFLQESFPDSSFIEDIFGIEINLIPIYPELEYQTIIGFGGAFTESAAYTLQSTSPSVYYSILKEYFSSEGIRYSFCRTPIASCDFSLTSYDYLEKEDLSTFSIEPDRKYLLPMLKKAFEINKNIILLASPWSPPAFMKDNQNRYQGGKLLKKYKPLWANYLAKYVQEYQKEGIPISYMTIQNEPKAIQSWESCLYSPSEEADLLVNYIYPTFLKYGLPTKFLVWDHNKERLLERAISCMRNNIASSLISGFAFHWYSGDYFENIEILKSLYPNKLLLHTEGCTGYSNFSPEQEIPNAEIYGHQLIGDLNAGINGFIDWNMVLDYNGGPNHKNNFCNAPIMINKDHTWYIKNLSFYYIAHFSKYILKGAKKIGFSKYSHSLEITAFKNPDNTLVLIIMNTNENTLPFTIRLHEKLYSDTISPHSILTYCISS